MPDNQTLHTTRIEIGGDIQASLTAAIQQAAAGLKKIELGAVNVGKEGKKGFAKLSESMVMAEVAAKGLKTAMIEMLLPLLGITLAFKGFETINNQIETLASNAEKAEMRTSDLAAAIEQMPHFRGISKEALEKEIGYVDKLSASVSTFSKGIIGAGTIKSGTTELYRHFQPTHSQIEPIMDVVAAYLVGSKKGKATPEDAADAGTRVGEALKSGKFGSIADIVGSFSRAEMKKIKEMSYAQRVELFKNKALYGQSNIAEFAKTFQGKLAIERTIIKKQGIKAGDQWKEVQEKGEMVSLKLTGLFTSVFEKTGEIFNQTFGGILDWIDANEGKLKDVIDSIFNPTPGNDIFKQLGDMWNTFFDKFTSDHPEVQTFLDWMWKRFDDIKAGIAGMKVAWDSFTAGFTKAFAGAEKLDTDALGLLGKTAVTDSFEIYGHQIEGVTQSFRQLGEFIAKPENQEGFRQIGEFFGKLAKYEWDNIIGGINKLATALQAVADVLGKIVQKVDDIQNWPKPITDWFTSSAGAVPKQPAAGGPKAMSPGLGKIASPSTMTGSNGGDSGGTGGIQFTRYGYDGDPDGDPASGNQPGHFVGHGIGNRNNALIDSQSISLSPDVAARLGASAGSRIAFNSEGKSFEGTWDDTTRADLTNRFDVYDPQNRLMDYDGAMGSVSKLARGGIVNDKLLSWLGESGPEAVIPLRRNDPNALGLMGQAAQATGYSDSNSGVTVSIGKIEIHGGNPHEMREHLDDYMRREFPRHLNDAFEEHRRRNFN
jgi:hypothetical protein